LGRHGWEGLGNQGVVKGVRLTPSNPYEIGIKMARSSTKPCFVAVRVTVIFWEGIAIEQIHLEHGTWIAASICLNGSV
jgi:hypothetical protein